MMKIKIKEVAKFDTSKISDLRFDNDHYQFQLYKTIQLKHIQTTTYVKVYNYLHGMYDTVGDKDNVVI